MKYKIIEENTRLSLETEVMKHLKEGYKLAGGVSAFIVGFSTYYCQAVYKED